MQHAPGARQQLAAAIELEQIVGITPVSRTSPARHDSLGPKPTEVVGDEILRQLQTGAQLTDPPIAVGQLAQQPPPDRVPREPKKARRSGPCRRRLNGHPAENTS